MALHYCRADTPLLSGSATAATFNLFSSQRTITTTTSTTTSTTRMKGWISLNQGRLEKSFANNSTTFSTHIAKLPAKCCHSSYPPPAESRILSYLVKEIIIIIIIISNTTSSLFHTYNFQISVQR